MVGDAGPAHELAVALEELEARLSQPMRWLGERNERLDDWLRSTRRRIVPRLKGEIPLIVGLCGGGNSGKSTLFNALAGRRASAVGPKAGLTRRAVLAIPSKLFDGHRELLETLFHSFGGMPEPLPERAAGTPPECDPGPPLYVLADEGIPNAIVVDMPDMDVAANDMGYANRENAGKILAACDLLVMLAGNATYNNRDIAEFMRGVVSDNGRRGAVLVYRFARPKAEREHVRDAFATMAENLYPGNADPPILARFVALEDHGVRDGSGLNLVSGDALFRDDGDGPPAGVEPLRRIVAAIDRVNRNREDTIHNIRQGLAHARGVADALGKRLEDIRRFHEAVRLVTRHKARTAFTAFPMEEFRSLAAELWKDEQNAILKFGRRVGSGVRAPMVRGGKLLANLFARNAANAAAEQPSGAPSAGRFLDGAADLWNQLRAGRVYVPQAWKSDVSPLAGCIRGKAVDPDAALSGREVPMPDAIRECVAAISGIGYFESVQGRLVEAWGEAVRLPDTARETLRPIIRKTRMEMSAWDAAKEYGACVTDIALPMAAVAYVALTGDAATGSILGALEVGDLLAVVAVPIAFGAGVLQKRWIREGLDAVVGEWQNARAPILERALGETVSGGFIEKCASLTDAAGEPVKAIGEAIRRVESAFDAWADEGAGRE